MPTPQTERMNLLLTKPAIRLRLDVLRIREEPKSMIQEALMWSEIHTRSLILGEGPETPRYANIRDIAILQAKKDLESRCRSRATLL